MPESADGRDIVGRLLREAGLPEEVAGQAGDPALEDRVLTELEQLTTELPREERGGTRVVIKGRFFSVGEAGWKLLTSVAALAISSLDPTGLTKVVALKEALDLLKALRPLLKKLDPASELVCAAIAAITADKKRQGLAERGASEEDIVKHFHGAGQMSPIKLGDILKRLEADGVLEATRYALVGPFYSIRF
jgi:hypothetical protein